MQLLLLAYFFLVLNSIIIIHILFINLHTIINDFRFIHAIAIIILRNYFINLLNIMHIILSLYRNFFTIIQLHNSVN